MKRLVIDSGASVTLTPQRNDFYTYRRVEGKVKGLGTMNIVGKGSVKYTVRTITGEPFTLVITNVYHVPGLPIRLLSPQQLIRQYKKRTHTHAECVFRPDGVKVLVKNKIFSITYDERSDLPIWKTNPGAEKATKILNTHFSTCYLSSKSTSKYPTFAPIQIPTKEDFSYLPHPPKPLIQNDPAVIDKNEENFKNTEISKPSIQVKFSEPTNDSQININKNNKPNKTNKNNNKNSKQTSILPVELPTQCTSSVCPTCTNINKTKTNVSHQEDNITFQNLTDDQRLLLHYHCRLDHMNMLDIQALASEGFLPRRIAFCDIPLCAACQIGKAKKKAVGKSNLVPADKIYPGDLIHMDQAESTTPGRPLTYSGQNNKNKIYFVTVFVDSISKKIFVEFQHTNNAKETLKSKHNMEREAHQNGVKIKPFRADNGVFKATPFRIDLEASNQNITFCGVGAHHQNGIAERFIGILTERARTVLLNAHARNTIHIPMELWTFAFRHVCTQWNNTPRKELNWCTPNEMFAGVGRQIKRKKTQFQHFHPFGCPVYILHEAIQDNKKPPRWNPRSRVGIYLGKSKHHASDVAWVLNTKTGNVSPQYHVVHDDNFSTTKCTSELGEITIWKGLYKACLPKDIKIDFPLKETFDPSTPNPTNLIDLESPSVLDAQHFEVPDPENLASIPSELEETPRKKNNKKIPTSPNPTSVPYKTKVPSSGTAAQPGIKDNNNKALDNTIKSSEGATKSSEGGIAQPPTQPPNKPRIQKKFIQKRKRRLGLLDPAKQSRFIAGARRSTRLRTASAKLKDTLGHLASFLPPPEDMSTMTPDDFFAYYQTINTQIDSEDVNDIHPLAFAAKSSKGNPNILRHKAAMKAPDADKQTQSSYVR